MRAPGRRPNLSPLGLDIILATSQAPHGIRLSDLATVIGSPVSSVQTALRTLIANGLVRRHAGPTPRYGLAKAHPAHDQLVALATVLPEPEHAIAVIVRASPAVAFAAADGRGFVIAVDDATEAAEILASHLSLIRETHDQIPPIDQLPGDGFGRLATVDLELRSRLERAILLKGSLPRQPRPSAATRTARQPAATRQRPAATRPHPAARQSDAARPPGV